MTWNLLLHIRGVCCILCLLVRGPEYRSIITADPNYGGRAKTIPVANRLRLVCGAASQGREFAMRRAARPHGSQGQQ